MQTPSKNKSELAIVSAFTSFMNEVNKVNNFTWLLITDLSFSNIFKKEIKKHGITHYFVDAGDKNKLNNLERFNRTLRD